MSDEQIKEITIALINSNMLWKGANNEAIALDIAKFINLLKAGLNSNQ